MKLNPVSCKIYQNNSPKLKSKHNTNACSTSAPGFRGKTGFVCGAVAGGVIASLFNDAIVLYAVLGAIMGDFIDNIFNNHDRNDNNENRNNLRMYK